MFAIIFWCSFSVSYMNFKFFSWMTDCKCKSPVFSNMGQLILEFDQRKNDFLAFIGGWRTSQPRTFQPQTSTPDFLIMNFSIPDFSIPDFSTMNFGTIELKSSWLKSLGLKGPGLKRGIEKSRVEMSFNLHRVGVHQHSILFGQDNKPN